MKKRKKLRKKSSIPFVCSTTFIGDFLSLYYYKKISVSENKKAPIFLFAFRWALFFISSFILFVFLFSFFLSFFFFFSSFSFFLNFFFENKMGGGEFSDVDAWIEKLLECNPLTENEVKLLCDKVSFFFFFLSLSLSLSFILLECNPLMENEVKLLCDKVSFFFFFLSLSLSFLLLFECNPLTENEVKLLCDKDSFFFLFLFLFPFSFFSLVVGV